MLAMLAAVCIAGCANPYAVNYRGLQDARQLPEYDATEVGFKAYKSADLGRDRLVMLRHGYIEVGYSGFTAKSSGPSWSDMKAQANKVGAQVALTNSRYSHTEQGAMPLILPFSSTTYATGSATAYGPRGMATAYGSARATTTGTQTTVVPFSVAHSQVQALYFAKARFRLGLHVVDMDTATRRFLGTNVGVIVEEIVDDTEAAFNDFLPGDVITEVGDTPIRSVNAFREALAAVEGMKVSVTVLRNGEEIPKKVAVEPLR